MTKAKFGYVLVLAAPVVKALFSAMGKPEAAQAVEDAVPHIEGLVDAAVIIMTALGGGLLHFAASPNADAKKN